MSITSRFKKDRLFQFIDKFSVPVDNGYFESYYYLIRSVEYNDKKQLSRVCITIIIDIKNYLNLEPYKEIEQIFTENFPDHIIANVAVLKVLID
jgi:hypothetical protein